MYCHNKHIDCDSCCTPKLFKRPPTRSLSWSEETLCTTTDAATSLAIRSRIIPCLLPCAPAPISPGYEPLLVTTPRTCKQTTCSAKWPVNAVLQSSYSFRHCCIFGLLLCSVKSSSRWCQALCCSSSLASLSSPGWYIILDVQMLYTRMMMWTSRTHVLATQDQETTIRVSFDSFRT